MKALRPVAGEWQSSTHNRMPPGLPKPSILSQWPFKEPPQSSPGAVSDPSITTCVCTRDISRGLPRALGNGVCYQGGVYSVDEASTDSAKFTERRIQQGRGPFGSGDLGGLL